MRQCAPSEKAGDNGHSGENQHEDLASKCAPHRFRKTFDLVPKLNLGTRSQSLERRIEKSPVGPHVRHKGGHEQDRRRPVDVAPACAGPPRERLIGRTARSPGRDCLTAKQTLTPISAKSSSGVWSHVNTCYAAKASFSTTEKMSLRRDLSVARTRGRKSAVSRSLGVLMAAGRKTFARSSWAIIVSGVSGWRAGAVGSVASSSSPNSDAGIPASSLTRG